ncbi:MAG: hypothetical protein M3261_01910 [Thermoproteota archaeon]|nr:hypothetical protein [Thermoproteota archaeon]
MNITPFTKLAVLKVQSGITAVIATIAITAAVTIDYLASRQMFAYDNFSGAIIFGFTIVAGAAGYSLYRHPWRWEDFQNAYFFRSIFRAGLIAGSIMFGVSFLVIARKVESERI